MRTLPPMTGRLAEIVDSINPKAQAALVDHLLGGTSADWLAVTLTREGYPISASTIRTNRRAMKLTEGGV